MRLAVPVTSISEYENFPADVYPVNKVAWDVVDALMVVDSQPAVRASSSVAVVVDVSRLNHDVPKGCRTGRIL